MGKLNPWLKEKLRVKGLDVDGPALPVIIEVEPAQLNNVLAQLQRMGIQVKSVSFGTFIAAVVPRSELIEAISRIPGVKMIHYDMPITISAFLPFRLSKPDPLLGEVSISGIEVPEFQLPSPIIVPPPLSTIGPKVKRRDVEIIPTEQYIVKVLDVPMPPKGEGVRVAGIDTGLTPFHPQFVFRRVHVETVQGLAEPPFDFMGHGQWISGMITGCWVSTRFGKVGGIAPNAHMIHIKALSTMGFGSTSWILKAMERAMELDAQVVSMSLGGEPQGPVDSDPLCKATEILANHGILVVVAAGNSGPNGWTIASPGFCPKAITVGSISLMDGAPAWFSSRGPSGRWYYEHQDRWEEDYNKYGDVLIKPDIMCFGGGRANRNAKPDEVLYQGVTGWFDSFYDLVTDGFEGMHGSSQSTPCFAGLMVLLKQVRPEITVDRMKQALSKLGEKSYDIGWGFVSLKRLKELLG